MATSKVIILAIDGGGIRGILPAYFLSQIEQLTGKSCYELFDIIGGTSTGGILSAGLTTINPGNGQLPFSAASLLNIYLSDGNKIFVPQNRDFHATYFSDDGNGNGVEAYLRKVIGNALLSDSRKACMALAGSRVKQMFTTGYVVNSTGNTVSNPVIGRDFGPYLFNWEDASGSTSDDYYVWEAARATSAAPVYFPIAHVGGSVSPRSTAATRWVVDGGTMSNNPAIWAVSEAFRLQLAQSLSDIIVISIGTGVYRGACGAGIHTNVGLDCPDDGNWSKLPWIAEDMYDLQGFQSEGLLINVILDAVQLVASSQLNSLQKGGLNYFRLEPDIPQSLSAMDNISPDNIKNLLGAAKTYINGDGASLFAKIISVLRTG